MRAAICGTREPTAKNLVATAIPKSPVEGSRATIDHVMGARLPCAESPAAHNSSAVITGLVPVIPARRAQCLPKRDGRDKPGHDKQTLFSNVPISNIGHLSPSSVTLHA